MGEGGVPASHERQGGWNIASFAERGQLLLPSWALKELKKETTLKGKGTREDREEGKDAEGNGV